MLENHLIPHTNPVAKKGQIYSDAKVRITVLTPRLIRTESGGNYTDLPTQIVWFRDLDPCQFKATLVRGGVSIKTAEADFYYNYSKRKVTQVTFNDGKKVKTSENLKGTTRSLDNTIGATHLGDGIMSKTGVALMPDNSLLLNADGLLTKRPFGVKDIYVFAHGLDYRGALADFYKITGPVPLLPRAALGNWWSRWKAYSQDEYVELQQRFQKEHIPFSMATIDMDWHIVNVKEKFPDYKTIKEYKWYQRFFWGDGWTGYTWNRDLFPDYKDFLKWLHDNNLKTILNLHPSSGVRWFEDQYKDIAHEMGINPATREVIKFDMSDPKFINAYFKHLHRPYEKDGVDYWWVDWQQGRKSQQKCLDPLWALNHYHSLEAAREAGSAAKRPLILSRYSGPGSHRYPIGFSGDTMAGWRVLSFQPYFTSTAANIGYTWWSHDVGGHWGGIKNDELYLRWLQFGVYSPINRLHSTRNELMGKEIWNYRPDVEHYAQRLLIRRHKFIPYNYTMNYRTHTQGIPICEPLYYQYPDRPEAYKYRNQYFFGSELLVCPITKKSAKDIALSTVKIWLPEGRWTDIKNGRIYQGNREIILARELHEIPVFARTGAIIPMGIEDEVFNTGLPQSLDLHVFRGTNTFTLYEDNGVDRSHEQGNYATTEFCVTDEESAKQSNMPTPLIPRNLTFKINPAQSGNPDGSGIKLLPTKRNYKVTLKDITHAESVVVQLNGKAIKPIIKNSPLRIRLENIKPTDTVDIAVNDYTALKNLSFSGEVIRLFSRLWLGNIRKRHLYGRVKNLTNNKRKFQRRLRSIPIPKVLKTALKELIEMEN